MGRERPGTSINGRTVWAPKKASKKGRHAWRPFLPAEVHDSRACGRLADGRPVLCRRSCPLSQRRGPFGQIRKKVLGGKRGFQGEKGDPFPKGAPSPPGSILSYCFSRSSWLSRAWRTKTARTPGSSPRPVSTGRGVRPRARICEAQESGSSPARSLRAWSPATTMKG